MQDFIVSARKYRPMSFDTVVGQSALTTTLKNAIASGRLAHAYLFCGPRGVGKTTCARIFAKAINCLHPLAGGDACGECESCRAFDEQRSMNIHELDAASNNSVDDIRELITQVQIPPQIGKYKVFIIDEVHMLSAAAFNAFLKTLEEPPAYVIFILATTEKHKILPTILSRCQVFDFVRMGTKDIINHLRHVAELEGYVTEDEALNIIAQKADGGMRDALSIFDQMASFTSGKITYEAVCQNLNVLNADYYFSMTDHILDHDVKQCMLLLDHVMQRGFDAGIFISGMAGHLRDLLMAQDEQTVYMMEKSEQMAQRYAQQAKRCQPRFLYQAMKLCNDCDQAYRTSRNKRLQVEICLIQLEQLAEGDVPGSGLCPTKTLNPIFQQLDAASAPAHETAYAPVTTVNRVAETPLSSAPHTMPSQLAARMREEGGSKPVRIISGFGPSIKKRNGQEQKEAASPQASSAPDRVENHTPLDAENLRVAWYEFIQHLPREHQAMAQRMRDMRPALQDPDTIVLEVNNEQVKQSMEALKPQLLAYVGHSLHNDFVRLVLNVTEVQQAARRYSKTDLYARMAASNSHFKALTEALGLVIE